MKKNDLAGSSKDMARSKDKIGGRFWREIQCQQSRSVLLLADCRQLSLESIH